MYPDIYAYCRQGEDGPTHQPVEMLESLRAMPNLLVIRPADGNEVCDTASEFSLQINYIFVVG